MDWKLELGKQDCWLRDAQARIQRMISERKKKSLSSVSARRYAKLDWFHSPQGFFKQPGVHNGDAAPYGQKTHPYLREIHDQYGVTRCWIFHECVSPCLHFRIGSRKGRGCFGSGGD